MKELVIMDDRQLGIPINMTIIIILIVIVIIMSATIIKTTIIINNSHKEQKVIHAIHKWKGVG
jgi:hypothetical protein